MNVAHLDHMWGDNSIFFTSLKQRAWEAYNLNFDLQNNAKLMLHKAKILQVGALLRQGTTNVPDLWQQMSSLRSREGILVLYPFWSHFFFFSLSCQINLITTRSKSIYEHKISSVLYLLSPNITLDAAVNFNWWILWGYLNTRTA